MYKTHHESEKNSTHIGNVMCVCTTYTCLHVVSTSHTHEYCECVMYHIRSMKVVLISLVALL